MPLPLWRLHDTRTRNQLLPFPFLDLVPTFEYAFDLRFEEEPIPCNSSPEAFREHFRWNRYIFTASYNVKDRPAARRDWCLAVVRGILHQSLKK